MRKQFQSQCLVKKKKKKIITGRQKSDKPNMEIQRNKCKQDRNHQSSMVPVCVADKHYNQIISITTEIGEEMNKKPF